MSIERPHLTNMDVAWLPKEGAVVTISTRDETLAHARFVSAIFVDDRIEIVIIDDPGTHLPGRYYIPWLEVKLLSVEEEAPE